MDISWPVKNLDYKKLVIVPIILAAVMGSAIAYHWYSEGTPVSLSLEFSGGSYIRVQNIERPSESQIEDFRIAFDENFGKKANIHTYADGLEIETSADLTDFEDDPNQTIRQLLSDAGIEGNPQINTETMGSIVAQLYTEQARNAAIAALIAMAIILFIALRRLTAVGGILLVVGLDFLGILGAMAILGIPLSLSSMAGILLIFGYAVNTNILLSTNLLRRKGETAQDRAARAMNTVVKMSSTSAIAMVVLNLITTAPELEQISAVLVIGILVDMVNTWLLNSGILLRHKAGLKEEYHGRI